MRARARIIVVEDSDELREVFAEALEFEGYEVFAASSGEEGLELARKHRPDLVVTDVMMRGMNGLELVTRLRSDLAPPLPVLLVVSGFPDVEKEAVRRGANGFRTKPIELDDFIDFVGNALTPNGARAASHHERARSKRLREETFALAEATSRSIEIGDAIAAGLPHMLRWLGRFFDVPTAFLLFVRDEKFECVAPDEATKARPELSDPGVWALARAVLEADSPLVLPDVKAYPALNLEERLPSSVRFLVCVPLRRGRVPSGVLCLVDDRPHRFNGPDHTILDVVASYAAGQANGPRLVSRAGLLSANALERICPVELEVARRTGAATGMALIRTDPLRPSPCRLLGEVSTPRTLIGQARSDRILVTTRAPTAEEVEKALDAATELVSEYGAHAAARVVLSSPLPQLAQGGFLAWAEALLALADDDGSVVRVAVEPTIQRGGLKGGRDGNAPDNDEGE